jgi:hypothetical protein
MLFMLMNDPREALTTIRLSLNGREMTTRPQYFR